MPRKKTYAKNTKPEDGKWNSKEPLFKLLVYKKCRNKNHQSANQHGSIKDGSRRFMNNAIWWTGSTKIADFICECVVAGREKYFASNDTNYNNTASKKE